MGAEVANQLTVCHFIATILGQLSSIRLNCLLFRSPLSGSKLVIKLFNNHFPIILGVGYKKE